LPRSIQHVAVGLLVALHACATPLVEDDAAETADAVADVRADVADESVSDVVADLLADAEPEVALDAHQDVDAAGDADSQADGDALVDGVTGGDADGLDDSDADGAPDVGPETGADADADTDTAFDAETDTISASDADALLDAEPDAQPDADGAIDAAPDAQPDADGATDADGAIDAAPDAQPDADGAIDADGDDGAVGDLPADAPPDAVDNSTGDDAPTTDVTTDAGDEVDAGPGCDDADGDERGVGCAAGGDCDDGDPDVWASCGACTDEDGDGYYVGCDAYFEREGPDCDDESAVVYPGAPELPSDGLVNGCGGRADLVPSDATGVFVSAVGSPDGAGTQADPLDDLAAGLALAFATGRSVFLSKGVWPGGNSTAVSIFGGYDPVTWARDLANPSTVIEEPTAQWAVRIAASGVALQGLTLLGGTGPSGGHSNGIYVAAKLTRITIADCETDGGTGSVSHGMRVFGRIVVTRTTASGGAPLIVSYGIRAENGARVYVVDSVLLGGDPATSAGRSYGLRATGGVATLRNSEAFGGSGESDAYAFQADTLARTAIVQSVLHGGDAAKVSSCTVFVGTGATNVLVHSYIHGGVGPGPTRAIIAFGPGARVTTVNSILDAGTSGTLASSIFATQGGRAEVVHSILGGLTQDCFVEHDGGCVETLASLNACAWSGCGGVTAALDLPPGLADPASGDFHLLAGSPAIDAGVDPGPWYRDGGVRLDLDGQPRPQGGSWDIGLDEVAPAP
jgi:hypothetical protein